MTPITSSESRLGVHYFPDTLHYSLKDLNTWLPVFQELKVGWVVLRSQLNRAIPENFLRGLIDGGCKPVVFFNLPPYLGKPVSAWLPIIEAYVRWGVEYFCLFDRPNMRSQWDAFEWSQPHFIDHFLDLFLPLAEVISSYDRTVIFPPLEPGGDYWDTAFLHTALEGIERRRNQEVLDHLVLGAYAWFQDKPLDWGAGGPERWPDARPYIDSFTEQDQRGFRIFEWYQAISRICLGRELPVLVLAAGNPTSPLISPTKEPEKSRQLIRLFEYLSSHTIQPTTPKAGINNLLSVNFWVLAAGPDFPANRATWFNSQGNSQAFIHAWKSWLKHKKRSADQKSAPNGNYFSPSAFPLPVYVLLPPPKSTDPLGLTHGLDQLLCGREITFGTSFQEAALARKVIVVGGTRLHPGQELDYLRKAGCEVVPFDGMGIDLAQILKAK